MRVGWLLLLLLLGGGALRAGEVQDAQTDGVLVILKPERETTLSARVSSTVLSLSKRLGDAVVAGEELLRLDATVTEAQKARREAELARAEAVLKAREKLYKGGSLSELELRAAEAEVATSKADLAVATYELEGCRVLAPFAGRIAVTLVQPHESVRPGQPLLKLIDDTRLRAECFLPADWPETPVVGMILRIRLETGEVIAARLTHLGPAIEPVSHTRLAHAEIANPERALAAGLRGVLLPPEAAAK